MLSPLFGKSVLQSKRFEYISDDAPGSNYFSLLVIRSRLRAAGGARKSVGSIEVYRKNGPN